MATSKDYCNFILEQLDLLEDVTARPMMGEFLLYYQGVLFGGIYDEKLLIKEVPGNAKFGLSQVIPYEGAKRTMYHLEDVDNKELLKEVVLATFPDLPRKKR